jgi:hypothetical protein
MKKKIVAIYERGNGQWKTDKQNDRYVFEGVFTKFDVINENKRKYRAKNVMPLVEALQAKVKGNNLLGELDHPERFDVHVKEASHVIEKLEYDPNTNSIRGRIRLLSTGPGEHAKRLVDDGIPLFISSRAAGVVKENSDVELKQIFTYDIVATPGFKEAKLNKINESLGFSNDSDLEIYDISSMKNMLSYYELHESAEDEMGIENLDDEDEDYDEDNSDEDEDYDEEENDSEEVEEDDSEHYEGYAESRVTEKRNLRKKTNMKNTNNTKKMQNVEYVKESELQKYSLFIKRELEDIYEQIGNLNKNYSNSSKNVNSKNKSTGNSAETKQMNEELQRVKSMQNAMGKYLDIMAKHVNTLTNYVDFTSNIVDKNICYSEHIAEKMNELHETTKKSIVYSKYLGKKLNESINYTERVATTVNSIGNYSDKLGKGLNESINYTEHIAKQLNESINYSEYLRTKLDESINYTELVANKVNETVNENGLVTESMKQRLNEGKKYEPTTNYAYKNKTSTDYLNEQKTVSSKLDKLFESVQKQKTDSIINEYNFTSIQYLSEGVKQKFLALTPAEKEKVVKAVNETRVMSENDILRVWNNVIVEHRNDEYRWISEMPEQYRAAWELMNESDKYAIIAQSKHYDLNTLGQIKRFWQTRGIEKRFEDGELPKYGMVKENKSNTSKTPIDPNAQRRAMIERISKEVTRRI